MSLCPQLITATSYEWRVVLFSDELFFYSEDGIDDIVSGLRITRNSGLFVYLLHYYKQNTTKNTKCTARGVVQYLDHQPVPLVPRVFVRRKGAGVQAPGKPTKSFSEKYASVWGVSYST